MVYFTVHYTVGWKKRIEREISKLPEREQKKLIQLIKDLQENGPIQKKWPNFSKLEGNRYHCHLSYSWVACWKNEKQNIIIEIYYVGSMEKAPY